MAVVGLSHCVPLCCFGHDYIRTFWPERGSMKPIGLNLDCGHTSLID